ncbi:MAG TPA: hypothetical protein DDW27_09905 [Bacteroidales bacterium]|nr:hypothetical protein [Bacteroidales bacterium]
MKEQEVEISNSILFEFQRYVRGEMTKREEFTFQKNIRKDLYAEAAIEGFTELPEEETSFFTNLAEEEEEKRMRSRKRLIYSIVASVIILLIATSAYLVVEKKITVKQFRPFKFLNSGIPAVVHVVTDPGQIAGYQKFESTAWMSIPDIRSVPELPAIVPDPATGGMVDPMIDGGNSMLATAASDSSGAGQVTPVSGSDIQRIADTTAALNKSSAKGYGSADHQSAGHAGYVAPQPVTGNTDFTKYIEENLRKPETLPEGENAVAVVSFVVRTTGNIDSIKVLSSPGEEYTAEAIRIIKEGPAWKPAENNGRVIEDEKMLRIVFK